MVHAPERPPAGAPPVRINLYSDTQTRPTPAMKDTMRAAEVGGRPPAQREDTAGEGEWDSASGSGDHFTWSTSSRPPGVGPCHFR
jgi:hypothetical protein